ncbi:sodium-dependent phosphate transport protein 2B [Ciona intestinalis]
MSEMDTKGSATSDQMWKEDEANHVRWRDMTKGQRIRTVVIGVVKVLLLLVCLYLFICSLVLMAEALNVLAGRVAVSVFTSNVFLSNPITGLIIGILVTVIIQSSSTSTSIVIAMVASGVISVNKGIPIVMGANIGTSVTNTAVALTLSMKKEEFRRAFAGATVHDCFNILSVVVLLPIEIVSKYLESLSGAVIRSLGPIEGAGAPRFLRTLTEPIVDNLIHVNVSVQRKIARNEYVEPDSSMVSKWCVRNSTYALVRVNSTSLANTTQTLATPVEVTQTIPVIAGVRLCERSDFLFANTGWSDAAVGGLLFFISLFVLVSCLLGMVKILTSSLKRGVKRVISKAVNTNLPKPFGWLSSYIAVFVGCGVTMLIQSSSVVTSTLTPLVGLGVVKLKRMYAVTVGANMGTTLTAVLAALATGNSNALQLAFCHFFFNISGFVIWYPLPFMRRVPIRAATGLGNITAKYRWFSIFYVISVFFVIPGIILGLSFAPLWVLITAISIAAAIIIFIIIVNTLQSKKPRFLPRVLRTWDFLPDCMHSLKPLDRLLNTYCGWCKCCQCCHGEFVDEGNHTVIENHHTTGNTELPMYVSNGEVNGNNKLSSVM